MTTHQHLNVIIGKYVNVLQSYDPEWPKKKKKGQLMLLQVGIKTFLTN